MTCQYPDLVVRLIGWSKLSANQTYYPDLGSERSRVWSFCPHFPDVIMKGNQLWPGEMSAVFSGCYKKVWKWLHECIWNSFYMKPPSFLCTVEPCLMATSVTRSPRYFGYFFCGLYISLQKTPVNVNLLQFHPINMATCSKFKKFYFFKLPVTCQFYWPSTLSLFLYCF